MHNFIVVWTEEYPGHEYYSKYHLVGKSTETSPDYLVRMLASGKAKAIWAYKDGPPVRVRYTRITPDGYPGETLYRLFKWTGDTWKRVGTVPATTD